MRGTFPIVLCDHEDGCTEWFLDNYRLGVTNWRSFVPDGWDYDPYRQSDEAFCPEHSAPSPIRPKEQ